MMQDVSWPKASEGGKVVGNEEIRAYWTRQWGEFDPHVEPLAITEGDEGKVRVSVHQPVKSLQGGNRLRYPQVIVLLSEPDVALLRAINYEQRAHPTWNPFAVVCTSGGKP
jgi:hypothetical protein